MINPAEMDDADLAAFLADGGAWKPWVAEPYQQPPLHARDGSRWNGWLLQAGRSTGKTDTCAAYFNDYMVAHPGTRGGIVAPTLGDAAEACVMGLSGLMAHNPMVKMVTQKGGTVVNWPNGSRAKLFGASTMENIDRLRAGGNRELDWYEELAAWVRLEEAFDQAQMGLRIGEWPHWIASTTPRPRKTIVELNADQRIALTRATIEEAVHMDPARRRWLIDRYAGTRIGRQELYGELLKEAEGALWTFDDIDRGRIPEGSEPPMARIVVAVDPAGTATETSDYTAVVVAGKGVDGEYYVLEAMHYKLSPHGWATRVLDAYEEWEADLIVAETNMGWDVTYHTLKQMGSDLPVKQIKAKKGKVLRAEPIAALYEQGRPDSPAGEKLRVHHVGVLTDLEDEMIVFPVESEHDDLCIAKGTLVATEWGEMPVENVRAGMRVWTREGLKRVRWAGLTATDTLVYAVWVSGSILWATPSHRAWTGSGWTSVRDLRVGDVLARLGTISGSKVSHTAAIPSPRGRRTGATTSLVMGVAASIGPYGSRATGRSPRPSLARRSTTSRRINSTTGLSTWSASRLSHTTESIRGWIALAGHNALSILSASARWLPRGMQALRVSTGMPATGRQHGRTVTLRFRDTASTAARRRRSSSRLTKAKPDPSATWPVPLLGTERPRGTTETPSARSAAATSNKYPEGGPRLVPASVERLYAGSARSDVYNLAVEDAPEFFANGVLVHNCDALVYALTELTEGKKPIPAVPFAGTSKSRDWV